MSLSFLSIFLIILSLLAVVLVAQGIRVVPQSKVWTVERWGRFTRKLEPGLHIITPFVETIGHKLSLREKVLDVPSSHAISSDNVLLLVDSVAFYKIIDPVKAAYEIEGLESAITNIIVNNVRTVLGSMTMDDALAKRDVINNSVQMAVGDAMLSWGAQPTRIEIKDLHVPDKIQNAMSEIATAERIKKAEITNAEGEKKAAILRSEGVKQSQILTAEGENKAVILAAQANKERVALESEAGVLEANAESKAIETVSKAVSDGDKSALTYFLGQKYTETLQGIASSDNSKLIMMPLESSNLIGALSSVTELVKGGVSSSNIKTP